MKRKEKETYWLAKIEEYRASGLSLVEWCETSDVALHNMKYWLLMTPNNDRKLMDDFVQVLTDFLSLDKWEAAINIQRIVYIFY